MALVSLAYIALRVDINFSKRTILKTSFAYPSTENMTYFIKNYFYLLL